jgi:hypothetical protein
MESDPSTVGGGGEQKKLPALGGEEKEQGLMGLMAERRPSLRRKCATVLRLGTGDVIPGMRALPAELRDAQVERSALIF